MVRIAREGRLPFALGKPVEKVVQDIKEARKKPVDRNCIFLNLICAGVNELVDRGLINLNSEDDASGSLDTVLFEKPAWIIWRGIGFGELSITVWWNVKPGCRRETTNKPLAKQISKAVDACCTAWLERKKGKWIQVHKKGELARVDEYLSRSAQNHIGRFPDVAPHAYERGGRFMM